MGRPEMHEIETFLGRFAFVCAQNGVRIKPAAIIEWRGVEIAITDHQPDKHYIEGWAFNRRITPHVEKLNALDKLAAI